MACLLPTNRFFGFLCAAASSSLSSISTAIPKSTSARSSSILLNCRYRQKSCRSQNLFELPLHANLHPCSEILTINLREFLHDFHPCVNFTHQYWLSCYLVIFDGQGEGRVSQLARNIALRVTISDRKLSCLLFVMLLPQSRVTLLGYEVGTFGYLGHVSSSLNGDFDMSLG